MQGFEVRLAKRLNSALTRRGKLFARRYHRRSLRTPREVFNAFDTCCSKLAPPESSWKQPLHGLREHVDDLAEVRQVGSRPIAV
jgi:hypothetical protein